MTLHYSNAYSTRIQTALSVFKINFRCYRTQHLISVRANSKYTRQSHYKMLKRQILKRTGLNQRRKWKSAPIGLIPPDQYRASQSPHRPHDTNSYIRESFTRIMLLKRRKARRSEKMKTRLIPLQKFK